ncbi:MAG: class I SAM-dependent methyltransferase [Desulfitobacteriaceae bacterium]|nr:class I SAM-dependent methyltransferase [Desulfitobacteriaceae bacterium]
MGEKPSLFNRIAAVYGLFFKWQVRNYRNIFAHAKEELDFSTYQRAIDIGCGTGALCQVLQEYSMNVTGIDSAEAMLAIAEKKIPGIRFMRGDVLKGLPFPDKSFDLAISSYVAHGFMPGERLLLYQEMSRVARHTAVLIDYNEHRSLITDIAEWLEGGDYFSFIGRVRDELMQQFGNLKVINTGKRSAMYICRIKD